MRDRNPYVQVALTYLRRPFSSWPGCILMVVLAVPLTMLFFLPSHRPQNAGDIGFLLGYALMALGGFFFLMILHVKDQCADSRCQLMPGFRRVHGTLAVVASLMAAVLLPAAFTWLAGIKSCGFIAAAVFLFGVVLWTVLGSSNFVGAGMAMLWFGIMTPVGHRVLSELTSGCFEREACILGAFGATAAALGLFRLFHLNEDMPEYHRRPKWDANRKTVVPGQWQGDRGTIPHRLRNRSLDGQMASLTRHVRNGTTSRWSRICRWQAGMFSISSLALYLVGMALYVQFLTWILPRGASRASLSMIFFCLNIAPLLIVMGSFIRRKATFVFEVLMPVDRSTYLKQVGAAAALCHFQVWAGTGVALLLWWMLFLREPLQYTTITNGVTISAAFQICAFAAMAWTLRYRSRFAVALMLGPTFAIPQMLFVLVQESPLSPVPIALVVLPAMLVAILGFVALYFAYRRWLVADFE